jgi:RND family efflux transporter MFP subunit
MFQSFPPVRRSGRAADALARLGRIVHGRDPLSRPAVALGGAVLAATLAASLRLGGAEPARADAPPLPVVTVSVPLERSIVEWDDHVGRFEASEAVEVRPRVSGQLVRVHFRDGEMVRRGQLLFTIDPRPFAEALAEARARAAAARAAAAQARSEYVRASRLVDDDAVSREEVESLRAAMLAADAGVAAASAVVQQRALDLGFTRVVAPISGRISDRRVDAGNLVGPDQSLLTTIHALDPIHFSFEGSEALYLKTQRAREAGRPGPVRVEIRLQDEAGYRWQGRVDFTDNGIDPRSGTVRARAAVANPDNFLTPGMFGQMRLASAAPVKALLLPDAAVRTDQARKVVHVVGSDNVVVARAVTPGPMVGGLRSIRAGLAPTDRVVIAGLQMAAPGARVRVAPGRIAVPATAAPSASAAPAAASQATFAG